MSISVLDPTSEEMVATRQTTARLTSLEGCKVGLLDNGKIRVHELLNFMEAILRKEHGVAEVVRFKKPDASRPVPAEVLAEMKACDALISAVGD
ncbi:hypothetical protein C2W62_01610 [Candidatus Entotheonella serta]|nr:hypothetical protein C2W62_01610 [Candidatus Entotheonella serta]